jgi:hypothetical protein
VEVLLLTVVATGGAKDSDMIAAFSKLSSFPDNVLVC